MSELQELVGFLNNENPVVKTVALQNLLGYSVTHKHIFRPDGLKPINDLINITLEKGNTNQKVALSILVNVSDDDNVRSFIIKEDEEYIPFIVELIRTDSGNAALFCMLLANLSFNSNFRLAEPQIAVLLLKYIENKPQHDYLSYVFVNYTSKLEGRKFFLKEENLLSIIVFNHSDNVRRKEAGGRILKNLLFSTEYHLKLIEDEKIELLTYILTPLMCSDFCFDDDEEMALPEDLQFLDNKELETNATIIETYLECLLLLCTTKPVRIILREHSVYPIIRELHKVSKNERVLDLCEQLVQFLARDEAPEMPNEESSQSRISEIHDNDEEDEDDQVIEVL